MAMFGRYIFGQATAALLLILGSLGGVVWIALALKQLKVVTTQGQDSWTMLKMTTLALPNLLVIIAPIALLIAVIHILNRLNSDSELIVFTASGSSPWRVARPLLVLALVVAVALTLVNHVVTPWSSKLLRQYVIKVRTDLMAQVLRPGRFSTPTAGLIIHIADRDTNGVLTDVMMHDGRNPKNTTTYLAKRGTIQKRGKSTFLILKEGHIITRSGKDGPADVVKISTYAFDLANFHRPGAVTTEKPRELYLHELLQRDLIGKKAKNKADKRKAGLYRAELHQRFSNPLYPFAFVLLAVAFVGQAQSTRQNKTEATIAAFAVAIGLRLVGMGAKNTVVINASAAPLLYAVPIFGILLGIYLIHRRARPLHRSRLSRIMTAVADGLARLRPPSRRAKYVESGTGSAP